MPALSTRIGSPFETPWLIEVRRPIESAEGNEFNGAAPMRRWLTGTAVAVGATEGLGDGVCIGVAADAVGEGCAAIAGNAAGLDPPPPLQPAARTIKTLRHLLFIGFFLRLKAR
jgi:hypothetical protein